MLTAHHLPLTTYPLPLTTYRLPLTAHHSPIITHRYLTDRSRVVTLFPILLEFTGLAFTVVKACSERMK